MGQLEGSRILVVGASSGIGRVLGLQAAGEGAKVAFAARRQQLVDEAAAEAGGIGLTCDVRDEASCSKVVEDTVAAFGGLDAIVYSTAIDLLVRIEEASMQTWTDTFATNVFGAGLITAAALPHLKAAKGRAVFISASSVPRPLPGMGVYASSKAALETMVTAWQQEHPDLCFANVRVGSALGTGVTDSWDRELLTELSARWGAGNYVHDNGPGGPMTVDQAASAVLDVLTSRVWLRDVTAVSDPGRENWTP